MRRHGLKRYTACALALLLAGTFSVGADVAEETAKRCLELSRAAEASADCAGGNALQSWPAGRKTFMR